MAFFLRADGANNTPTGRSSAPTWYSTTDYFSVGGLRNDDGFDVIDPDSYNPTKHFGTVQYEGEIIFGCEDLSMGESGADRDYNDVMFLINITGRWDDTYIPHYECDEETEDCDVYECTAATEHYVGVEFQANVDITLPGGYQNAVFKYSWTNGGWEVDGNGDLLEVHTYDTYCTTDHDGEYLFSQGNCGCEETFIDSNQPQLFVDDNSDYYNPSYTTIANFEGRGFDVKHYVSNDSSNYVTDLFLRADNDHIVRAIYLDGRILDFSDVVYSPASAPVEITPPLADCTCRRNLDVVLLLEKSGDVTGYGYEHVRTFVENFVDDQTLTTQAVNIGIREYSSTGSGLPLLAVHEGYSSSNVDAVVANLGCAQLDQPCENGGGDGNLIEGINKAVADHAAAERSASQVIVVVTNGWPHSSDALHTAIDNAYAAGVTIIGIPYGSTMTVAELQELSYVNGSYEPDNIVFFYQALDLSTTDTINVSSRTCLVADSPCGNCCGVCDSTCSSDSYGCLPVDECPPSNSCTEEYVVGPNQVCCTLVQRDDDPCFVEVDEGGNVVAPNGNPDLSPCQTAICIQDPSGEFECSFVDECVNTPCTIASCTEGEDGGYYCFTEPREASNDCLVGECITNDAGDEIEFRETDVECPAPSNCRTVECVVDGNGNGGCEYTAKPDPNDPNDLCHPYVCQGNNWVEVPVECDGDSCTNSECVQEGDSYSCVESPVCTTDDPCLVASCVDGTCSTSPKDCGEAAPCMEFDECVEGECRFVPRVCSSPNHSCEAYECQEDTCVHVEENDLCDVCDPVCTNNVCERVPCVNQECVEADAVFKNCTTADTCLLDDCDPDVPGGCTHTPIGCDHLIPSDSCHVFIKDSTYEGCCREVPKDCGGSDLCSIYDCDVTTIDGCTVTPVICTAPSCRDNNPSFNETNGCNPDTGLCPTIPRQCDESGCEVEECNVGTNKCEVVSADQCACNCTPNNVCQTTTCLTLIEPQQCNVTVERVCEPSEDQCLTNPRCDIDAGGCIYDEITCDDLVPEPCMRYIKDTEHEGCCRQVPVECPTGGPDELCTIYLPCNVTTNSCPTPAPKMCVSDDLCDIIHPEYNDTYGCDPENGNCVFAPFNCNASDDCREHECNKDTGECELVSEEQCSICEEPCTINKCQRTPCIEQKCSLENTTYTDCETPVADDECTFSVGCDPVEGCQYESVDCTDFPHTTCETVEKDPAHPGCCKAVPLVCPADTACNSYECIEDEGCVKTNLCAMEDSPCLISYCRNNECRTSAKIPHTCPDTGDLCMVASCDDNNSCINEPVVCSSPDLCLAPACNPEDGTCVFPEIDCDDDDPCTIDSCSEGICSNVPKDCNPTNNLCLNTECEADTGRCLVSNVVCEDDVACTVNSCDPLTGCKFVADDARCSSDDVCVESLGCDLELGCLTQNLTCADDSDFCTVEYCKPFEGCAVTQMDCTVDENNETKTGEGSGCGIINFCDSEEGQCAESDIACVIPVAAVVTASVLGTAAVVGIVVGIVVAVALCAGGAGVYQVYKNTEPDTAGAVCTNPLYMASSGGGENPLYHG
eukprot:TRINITY_DN483_c0_g1_i1.p1 TRINITY_DN483_c0_g1~~TRINITY_DN483_c0_g1_i1.p1  ORF type:complete len:1736 (-),score=312.28 TRINITY_DN483_c0_g1_i1:160-4842(-)